MPIPPKPPWHAMATPAPAPFLTVPHRNTLLASATAADLERTDPHGQTALMGAARLGSVDLCRLLLDRGADPRAASTQGITVLVAGVTRYG